MLMLLTANSNCTFGIVFVVKKRWHGMCSGVGGPADVWVVLESCRELIGQVSLCAEEHWPALIVGNGTNILYADAGVRGIVARVALNEYQIENQGDGTLKS